MCNRFTTRKEKFSWNASGEEAYRVASLTTKAAPFDGSVAACDMSKLALGPQASGTATTSKQ